MGDAAPAPNLFGFSQWDARPSFFTDDYILPQYSGWVIVCLFSAFFALVAWGLTYIDIKFGGAKNNSEQFNTAGRTIKSGLIAVDIVSHWTWASILLQSVTYSYFYGVSGAQWYAVTGAVNVWLFACMAIELKHKAPKAHTILEIIKIRWGKPAHIIFFCFAIFTNLLVTISMVQGAVSVTNVLCGVDIYALSFLIPLGIVVYSVVGGLKATFTTSYLHTIVILVVCLLFMFKVYGGAHGGGFSLLGGIDTIYERLKANTEAFPIAGNKAGSYLTGFSQGGLEVNIIFLISGFGQMFVDQSYWQSAVAASPTNAVKGYALASYIYMAIVFCLPLSMGIAALALNLPVNVDEALAGLVLPAAADAIIGKGGAVLIIIICFMAVTSSGAGELMAVSSLMTFDGYRQYINPKATSKQLVRVSRIGIVFWGIVAGAATCVVNKAGINVNWMIIIIGVMVGAAVLPIVFALLWDRCTALGACVGTLFGAGCAISSWLAYAKIAYGEVTVATTGMNYPVLTGSIVSLGMSSLVCVALTFMFPDKEKFDWKQFANIKLSDENEHTGITQEGVDSAEHIAKVRKPVWISCAVVFFLLLVVWPCLDLPAGAVWSKSYFTFWVVLGFFMMFTSTIIATFLPIWEARSVLLAIVNHMIHGQRMTSEERFGGPEKFDDSVHDRMFGKKGAAPPDDSAHGAMKISNPAFKVDPEQGDAKV